MNDTGRYRPGQDPTWRAYGEMRDDGDPPWEGAEGDSQWRDSRRRHGSDLRYGMNGGYGQETWADHDPSWSDVAEDDWGELRPHMFRNRDQDRTRQAAQPMRRQNLRHDDRPYGRDTHYDELRSDRRYWTDSGYGNDDGGRYGSNYREDARRAFESPDFHPQEDRGMLYNLGHRIGEVLGEWFGSPDDDRTDTDERAYSRSDTRQDTRQYTRQSARPDTRADDRYTGDRWDDRRAEDLGQRFGKAVGGRRTGPRNFQRSDERIRDEICERLTFASGVNVRDVSVDVSKGVVTLNGTVERRAQKYDIEDIADNTFGVTEVENNIRVERQPTDDTIAAGFNGS
ncbi:BON domain-containing protein [Cupriavidus pauculus]|nr:BON domain-containing protein [Cupriavidus pauculus]